VSLGIWDCLRDCNRSFGRGRLRLNWFSAVSIIVGLVVLSDCGGGKSAVPGGGGHGGDQTPQILSLSPASTTAGGVAFTLTINGTGFLSTSAVNWNGAPRTTTFHSNNELTASITAGDIASSGSASVTVVNPATFGSIVSGVVNFPINSNPAGPPAASVVAVVSVASNGTLGNRDSNLAAISANDRFVAFASLASNFSTSPNNGFENIFLHDTCIAAPSGCAPNTVPVSVAPDGSLGNGDSGSSVGVATLPAVSADGRFVAFTSAASNLVANDTNVAFDIFLRDTCMGAAPSCTPATIRVSVASDDSQSNDNSFDPSISADGRFVAFDSKATNLVANDTNGAADVFLRDTCIGAPAGCLPHTIRLSVASDGGQANDASSFPALSASGRYVAFQSFAKNLVPNDTTSFVDIFVRDTCFGAAGACSPTTTLISAGPGGMLGNEGSSFPTISSDGRFVAFASFASNLTPVATGMGINNVFVRDTCTAAPPGCQVGTALVSSSGNADGNGASGLPSISASGRFIAFNSDSNNLVSGDTNGFTDVFVRDTCIGAPNSCSPSTVRVSVAADGTQGNFNSSIPVISSDGHFVVFGSGASNLVPGDGNGSTDVFLANTSF